VIVRQNLALKRILCDSEAGDIRRYADISLRCLTRKNREVCQVAKEKKEADSVPETGARVKLLHTMDKDLKDWLDAERKKTGRSVSFMVELAVRQWQDRILKRRKYDE
jgi:hypothetical protein